MKKFIVLLLISFFATTMFAQERKNEASQKAQVSQMQQAGVHHHGLPTLPVIGSKDPKFMPPRPGKRIFDFRPSAERNIEHFRNWVQLNLRYPPLAVEGNISGVIYVTFEVKDGKIIPLTSKNILKGVNPLLDKEVIRVINSAPAWAPPQRMPGIQTFSMPVEFILK